MTIMIHELHQFKPTNLHISIEYCFKSKKIFNVKRHFANQTFKFITKR